MLAALNRDTTATTPTATRASWNSSATRCRLALADSHTVALISTSAFSAAVKPHRMERFGGSHRSGAVVPRPSRSRHRSSPVARPRGARQAITTRGRAGTTSADTGRSSFSRFSGCPACRRSEYVNALLKPAEVQALLGVSRAWVYAAAQDGRLPCVRLGGPDGPLRFRPTDLERPVDSWARS